MVDSLEKECCPDFVTEFHAACTTELASTLQSTQESIKSTCLSYKQIPFEDIGTVKFLLDFNGNVLSAVDEGGICHVCGFGPLFFCFFCYCINNITLHTKITTLLTLLT